MKTYLIYRNYLPASTIGALYESTIAGDMFVCFTVELAWNGNHRNISCIPEGEYIADFERHQKFGECYRLRDVEGRDGILIHVANKRTQLRGCIAPNLTLVSDQAGQNSRKALDLLPKETIKIIIQKSPYGPETHTHAPTL